MAAPSGDAEAWVMAEALRRPPSRKDAVRRVVYADFHAENLVNAFLAGLDVTRKKFGLLIDLLDHAVEGFFLKWGRCEFELFGQP